MFILDKRIKILFVVQDLEIGGTQKHTIDLVKGLDKNLFNIFVCCLSGRGALSGEVEDDKIFFLKKKKHFDFSLILKLAKIIKKENIDIVHTQNSLAAVYGRISAVISKVHCICTHHSYYPYTSIDKMIYFFLSYFTKRFVFVDKELKLRYVNNLLAKKKRSIIIHNGLELKNYFSEKSKKIMDEFRVSKKDIVIGFIGRLHEVKNLKLFIKAAEHISEDHKNIKFFIVGDGPACKDLRIYADRINLNNIFFTGWRNDIPDMISVFDIFVLTSHSEGLPIVLLEAMASKKSIVASDVGGINEIVKNGFNGFLAKPNNVIDFKNKINLLIENKKLISYMGQNGFDFVKDFDLSDFISKHQKMYLNLMGSK